MVQADKPTQSRSRQDVENMIGRLDTAFAPAKLRFELLSFTEEEDTDWASTEIDNVYKHNSMFETFHTGGYGALNLYFLSNGVRPGHGVRTVGKCQLPTERYMEHDIKQSGCVMSSTAATGDAEAAVAIHEVGHVSILM